MPSGIKITNESFKERAYIIHNMHKYSYDKVIVNGRDNEIEIFCNDCKEYFKQTPRIHLKGSGCQRCSYKFTADKKIEKSKKIFFEKIKEKDVNNNWDYSHVNTTFTGTNNSILLICNGCNEPTHRTPGKHLREFSACKKQCFIHKIIDKSNFNLLENIILEEKEKEEEEEEEWREVVQDNNYLISNLGRLKHKQRQSIIINGSIQLGYKRFRLNKKNYPAHHIVASAFIPNPENKKTVNHKNKNRDDNRVCNLEWATMSEQNIHKSIGNKTYKNHNNGKIIERVNKDTNEVEEEYTTLMLAATWILKNINKLDIILLDIDDKLKSMSTGISRGIKRDHNKWYKHGYIWRFKEISEIIENEEWKEIPLEIIDGLNGYQISSKGRFKNKDGKVKDKFNIGCGYSEIKVKQKGSHLKIHHLVAKVFISNPLNKPFVNHKDGNKLNNNVNNLEWVTNSENVQHGYDTGLNMQGLSPIIQYDATGKNIIAEYKSINDAAKCLKIGQSNISACCRGKSLTAGGFHFKYKENKEIHIRDKKDNFTCGKKVYQYDKNNHLIKVFNTISECASRFNVNKKTIQSKLKGSQSKNPILNEYIFTNKQES